MEHAVIPDPATLFSLTGKTALVTGGGGGLGLVCARTLAAAGARVAITGRNIHKLERAAAELLLASEAGSHIPVSPCPPACDFKVAVAHTILL